MKKTNIFKIALLVIAVIGVTFFFLFKVFTFAKNAKENIELTKQMSPVLLEMLKQKNISDFPYLSAPIQWEGKFLQVDNGIMPDTPLGIVKFVYNKQRITCFHFLTSTSKPFFRKIQFGEVCHLKLRLPTAVHQVTIPMKRR
jgi:hypothetical protein